MNTIKVLILIVLLSAVPAARAAELPSKPEPAGPEYWSSVAALGIAWGMDTESTADLYHRLPNASEGGGLFDGSRSTPKIMAAWAGIDVGAMVGAYEWKRHVHNRYLHPLWRIPAIVGTQGHVRSAISNWRIK